MSTSELDPFDAEIMSAVDATVAACRAEIATLRARVASMDEALQRIRIAAAMGNPMDPEKAAVTMGDIDELARVALRAPAAPKAPEPPPHDGEGAP